MAKQTIDIGTEAETKHWSPHIKRITIAQLDMLGVDDQQNLYWDGKRLKVERRFKLSGLQQVSAGLILIATIVAAIGTAFQGWAAVCQAEFVWAASACPVAKQERVEKGIPQALHQAPAK